eukprot:scaffold15440_cov30-Phaeocystis_antarctica.AAC.2
MQKPPASSCYSKNCTPGSEWSSGCGVVLGADARLFLWRRVVMGRSRELALTFEASERIVSSAEATGRREQFSPLAHTRSSLCPAEGMAVCYRDNLMDRILLGECWAVT